MNCGFLLFRCNDSNTVEIELDPELASRQLSYCYPSKVKWEPG